MLGGAIEMAFWSNAKHCSENNKVVDMTRPRCFFSVNGVVVVVIFHRERFSLLEGLCVSKFLCFSTGLDHVSDTNEPNFTALLFRSV